MQLLAALLVAKPLHILSVALILLATHHLSRRWRPNHPRKWPSLLVAALAWGLYAAWEAYVNFKTPEADIRVDLLVIWPLLAIVTLLAIVRAIWPRPTP